MIAPCPIPARVLAATFMAATLASVELGAAEQRVEANRRIELTVHAAREHPEPWAIRLDAVVTEPGGGALRVPGFWAGSGTWKVRYASPIVGRHLYAAECSDPSDPGLHGATGTIEVVPYTGKNPLYRHGPLRVSADRRHFEHADGTAFFWLGDTWWMGLSRRLVWPEEFARLTEDRRAKGFTVVQIVAGLYPDMPAFDDRGANEAGFPWEKDWSHIRPEYFDAADRRIEHLVESGLVPCVVGAWGYFLPWMGVEKVSLHWRYLVARYGALPVVWCIAGEANLPWYLAPGFPYDDREQVKGWTEVTRRVRELDPFHRLLTIHPTGLGHLSARGAIDDASLLDFDMLQTGHGLREVLGPTLRTLEDSRKALPTLPVVNGEVSYEALNDSIPAEIPRLAFWSCMLSGAAGHTYGANGIWQLNRKGEPHGASPHGGNYGRIPWDEAMQLPGSRQVGLGKRLLEEYRWERFEPHPEWASLPAEAELSFDGASWIWFPEGSPARDAPVEARFFRKAIDIPPGKAIAGARLAVSADDACNVWLNGKALGAGGDWRTGKQFPDVAKVLHERRNLLAIRAENRPAPVTANPAGLIARLEVRFADGETMDARTDGTWRCSKAEVAGWDREALADSSWAKAIEVGRHGDGPWGKIGGVGTAEAPCAAGVPGGVRMILVPSARAVTARGLESGKSYDALAFDAVTGGKAPLGTIRADAAGTWTGRPPPGIEADWVLILEPAGAPAGGAAER